MESKGMVDPTKELESFLEKEVPILKHEQFKNCKDPIPFEGLDRPITIDDIKDSDGEAIYFEIKEYMQNPDFNKIDELKKYFDYIELLVEMYRTDNKWFNLTSKDSG